MKFLYQNKTFVITGIVLLLCVVFISVSISYSWLSLNKQVEENFYGTSIKVTPNLVITGDSSKMASLTAEKNSLKSKDLKAAFTAVTHYQNNASVGELKCLASYGGVNRVTGIPADSTLTSLPGNDGKTYYKDFTVYVAATDAAIENACLTITLHSESTVNYLQAASVDVYQNSFDESNLVGTLNLAGKDAKKNDGTSTKTSLTVDLVNDTIPINTSGFITLCFRWYFDGALLQTPTKCYVNSDTVSTAELSFDILITETALSE